MMHHLKHTHTIRHTKAFSLVELMVALTLFSVVMLVSMSTLLVIIDANAKAQALQVVTTELSYALDSMTRNIRTASHFWCGSADDIDVEFNFRGGSEGYQNCDTGTGTDNMGVSFVRDIDGKRMAYRAVQLSANPATYQLEQRKEDTDWLPIVAPTSASGNGFGVEIRNFKFLVSNAEGTIPPQNDFNQPYITIILRGRVYKNNGLDTVTDFDIQSQVTPRLLDF